MTDNVIDVDAAEEPQPDEPLNGVLVVKRDAPDGDYTLEVQTVGDVRASETPVLLAQARKIVNAQLGVD